MDPLLDRIEARTRDAGIAEEYLPLMRDIIE
jgi:hypothetical protein